MKHSSASITFVCGMRGCGKSTLTHQLANHHARKIVFDYVDEWNQPENCVVKSYDEFANIFREVFTRDQYTIVVKFAFGTPPDDIKDISSQIITLLFKTGKDSEIEACLVFEEAQFYFPNHTLEPAFMSLLTIGRHEHLNIIANTQRPASVSKLLISQAKDIYIGQLYESNDIKYLHETVGALADEARNLKQLEFIHYPIGDHKNVAIVELK